MPNTTVYTNNQYYQNIAEAIRRKNGETTSYKPSEMAPAIDLLNVSGGSISVDTVTITPSSSIQTFIPAAGYVGFNPVTVNAVPTDTNNTFTTNGTKTPAAGKWFSSVIINVPVGSTINNQDKIVIPSTTAQVITASSGYTGLGTVTVEGVPIDINNTFTTNGTKTPASGKWFSSVVINVPTGGALTTTTLSVTPNTTIQTFTPPTGYGGFDTVTVEAIPSNYIVPTGTLTITSNGTQDVTQYASVFVNVPTSTSTASVIAGVITEEPDPAGGTIMYVNIVDLSQDTVAADYLVTGFTAHDRNGTAIVGTYSGVIINNQDRTVTSSTVTQTISAGNGYTGLGTVTINAIATAVQAAPIITVNSSGLISAVATQTAGYVQAGTVTITSQLSTKSSTTITPSTATQTAIAANTYATGAITVAPIPSNYITTSDATATASQILKNQTAYVNGSKVTGTMTNNGATGGTIASQGGTYTIPAGYTSGGTVTASLPVSTITNGILNVETVTEATNDYGVQASITIPAGYYNTTTLSRLLSNILPAPSTAAAVGQILSGYESYDYQGKLLVGTMTNRGSLNATLNDTLTSTTLGAGYYSGGTVSHTTVNIPDPTITISGTTGIVTASATWTKGFTTDNSYSATLTLTTKGAATITPGTTTQTISSGRWLTGNQTIAGDANLIAGNIKAGTSIFTVSGTFTSDATATSSDILNTKTAYVNGSKVTGSMVINEYYTGTTEPSNSIGNNGDLYLQA